jgi:hypothetical protein
VPNFTNDLNLEGGFWTGRSHLFYGRRATKTGTAFVAGPDSFNVGVEEFSTTSHTIGLTGASAGDGTALFVYARFDDRAEARATRLFARQFSGEVQVTPPGADGGAPDADGAASGADGAAASDAASDALADGGLTDAHASADEEGGCGCRIGGRKESTPSLFGPITLLSIGACLVADGQRRRRKTGTVDVQGRNS